MSEKRILITSVLKPVNDTRLFEKLAMSLNKLPDVSVHIAAFKAPIPPSSPAGITFHPIFNFKRLSFGRLVLQFKYFYFLLKVKPDIIIASTHELLLVSTLFCKFHNTLLVYDIRENYALNLRSQNNYSSITRRLLAAVVSRIERSTAPAVAHFFVAERSYVQELPFLGNKFTVVENKYKPNLFYTPPATPVRLSARTLRLLYSGTIAEVCGIFEAISLADQLHALNSGVTLTIIGYCAHQDVLLKLRKELRSRDYITLIGGDELVPHHHIIKQITHSDVGLLPYVPHESTFRCIPTKLYEYIAHALPMLVQENPLWEQLLTTYGAGMCIDYRQIDPNRLLQLLLQNTFYKAGIPEDVYWQTEEDKLLYTFKNLLKV